MRLTTIPVFAVGIVVENNSLSGDQAREAAKQAAESLKNTNTIGVSASLGSQTSKSTSHSEQDLTTGSRQQRQYYVPQGAILLLQAAK